MDEEARLKAIIDPTGAESGATAVARAVDRMRNSFVETSAKLFVVEQAMLKVWESAKKGADFEESLDRLNVQMRQWNSNANLMMNEMRNVSNGQLSMANSAQLASRALAMGLNPDQIRTFTQAADLLGDVMGTDLKSAFDTILQGLATGRTQMLANIGVHLDLEKEVKNLAVSTNRTTDQITKQERAAIGARAVMEQLGGTLEKFASDSVSDADKLAAVEARFDDLTKSISLFAKTLIVDAISAWEKFVAAVRDTNINPFAAANRAVEASTPGNMLNPNTQEIMGRAIVSDAQGNLARNANKPKPKPEPMDPKLLQIMAGGDLDRTRAAFEAAEKMQEEFFERRLGVLRGAVQEYRMTEVEATVQEVEIEKERVLKHRDFLDARISAEKAAFDEVRKIGFDTTEEKFQAEQKFNTTITSLLQERAQTSEHWHTVAWEGERKVMAARMKEHADEESWMNEHRALQIQLDQQRRTKAFDDEVAYFQALKNYREFNFESEASILEADLDLTRANLAKKTELTQEEASRLLIAWQNHEVDLANMILDRTHLTEAERSTIRLQYLQETREKELAASSDVASGWARGMQRYIKDTQSGFGMAQDMARRTAQMMEQSFQRFFFDAMDGRIQSFKDVMKSLLDFTKQIMSQIMAQLVTQTVLKGIMGGFPPLGDGPTGVTTDLGRGIGQVNPAGGGSPMLVNLPGFAEGGITSGPSLAGEAGPEAVIPLRNGRVPVQWTGGPYAQAGMLSTMSMPVTVNVHNSANADVQTETRQGPDGNPQIDVFIKNVVKQGMRNGEFDGSMRQFGANRVPVRRG